MEKVVRILSVIILGCAIGQGQVNILTANGSNDRTNSNLEEQRLAPATVTQASFGKLGSFNIDGQVYAQPLYVSGLSIPGKGSRNVLFVTSMHNTVYAFDADNPSATGPIWQVNLGASTPVSLVFGTGSYSDISVEIGILGTGAIDLQRGVLYVVAEILRSNTPAFYLHALDLTSGQERMNGPVAIAGSDPSGVGFDPKQHLQRPGLLLANDQIYIAFGSHGDQGAYHGWVIGYSASDLTQQTSVFATTPGAQAGAIWQSGRGLAADAQGNVYAMTGNGYYDGQSNYGESFLKLAGSPLARVDSFTPANWQGMSDNDFDLSAGPALLPGANIVLGADKLGNFYVLNSDSMGTPASGNSTAAAQFSIFNFAVWDKPEIPYVYVQGERQPIESFQLASGGLTPLSIGSTPLQYGRVGMTLSANGASGGILWETTGDYNNDPTSGTLHAFDAIDLSAELWNSDMNPGRDKMGPIAKFANPTVADGKVFVPTLGKAVVVYGVLGGNDVVAPSISVITNAASYSPDAVSPGELVTIFGSKLGAVPPLGLQLDDSGRVATSLGGTRVLFDGVPGPLAYTSDGQVNALVPFGVQTTSTNIQVEFQGQLSDAVATPVAPSLPGIFAADASGAGQGLILNQDGSSNSPGNPAAPGSAIVLYATGAGLFSPDGGDGWVVTPDSLPLPLLPVSATIGGQPASVLYAGGAPGIVEGVIQVNLQVPAGTSAGPAVEVLLQIGDNTSQSGLTLAVQDASTAQKRVGQALPRAR